MWVAFGEDCSLLYTRYGTLNSFCVLFCFVLFCFVLSRFVLFGGVCCGGGLGYYLIQHTADRATK